MDKSYNAQMQAKLRGFLDQEKAKGENGLSQNALGQQLGFKSGGSVLSSYLKSDYKGDVSKVEQSLTNFFSFREKEQDFRDTAKEQGLRPVDKWAYVPISISENVYKAIEYCRLVGGITILHGDAGCGKTMGVQKYKQDNKGFVLYFRACETCKTPKHIMSEVASQLGIQNCRNASERAACVREAIENSKKVLIVDDAHRLPQRSLEMLQDFAEPDNGLRKEGIGVVLIGNSKVFNFISTIKKEDMEQFRNRMTWEGRYRREQTKLDDVQRVFPYLAEHGMKKELEFLWSISKSSWGIRGAVNVYNNAVAAKDVSYAGLRRITAESRIGLI